MNTAAKPVVERTDPLALSPTHQALQAKVDAMGSFDWSVVEKAMVKKEGVTEEEAQALKIGFIQFAALSLVDDRANVIPSPQVDVFWHQAILHTRLYQAFCTSCLDGKYLHHEPTPEATVGETCKNPGSPCICTFEGADHVIRASEFIGEVFPNANMRVWK